MTSTRSETFHHSQSVKMFVYRCGQCTFVMCTSPVRNLARCALRDHPSRSVHLAVFHLSIINKVTLPSQAGRRFSCACTKPFRRFGSRYCGDCCPSRRPLAPSKQALTAYSKRIGRATTVASAVHSLLVDLEQQGGSPLHLLTGV